MSVRNGSPNCNKKSTPPTKERVRNPFDKVLIERLHNPICSPGMCKIYKKQKNGSFRWDIDQACTLLPADIVACSSQFEPTPDPVLEKIAEDANEKFFSQEMVVPSPLEVSKKIKPLLSSSTESNLIITSLISDKTVQVRDFSAQTVLSLPPELPPEIESILQQFCTFTQDQDLSGEYEITANGSLRRQLIFEEHSDMDHDDSEQTDDEIHIEQRPPSSFESHTPVTVSPDLSCDVVAKGMKRTFGTPLHKGQSDRKPCYRNKILDMVDFGEPCFSPIEFRTPKRNQTSTTSSSLASVSISPVTKAISSDEKNNFTSPESEAMATCLDCVVSSSSSNAKAACFCNIAPTKSIVKRSTSLKDSPRQSKRGSFSEKRSQSMSSLNRSRSVQKLDFSMDMSIDGSLHNISQADSESSPKAKQVTWSIEEDTSVQTLVKTETAQSPEIQSSTQIISVNNLLDETPIKGKHKKSILSHEISKIRAPIGVSPVNMSLDSSLENFDIPLCMEQKKIDFNSIDLKLLTDNVSQFDYNSNGTRVGESSSSFKRLDSGYNENTFYASSYYESAIKPSELTVTNPKINTTALKEISNINWMRVDSGFKDETSTDSMQFYSNDSTNKKIFRFSEAKLPDKENMEEYEKFLTHTSSNNEAISMSDIFTDDMTFNCNFSSTPSKNKSRNVNN
ncbi:protein aurora borealis [Pararge aegeria]|uniref:protein aurora borealis n=1 Tax=Pararge aegeria TaxID=116150 RepID=UPI0019D26AFC|nr:protein aurora borealis [Pararge aegeria]